MDSETQSGLDKQLIQEEAKELSDKYEILTKCGDGGCSKVYEGRRLSDDAQVALKLLCLSDSLEESEARLAKRRFYAEARVLQKLRDDHSVQCYDYGVYNGTPCYVMEYINGIELNNHLRNCGALSFEASVNIITQVLAVLSEAHECGIIHRDIKPENILILEDSEPATVRLIDFGIATIQDKAISGMQATQLGIIRGTPSYMAPEMFSGKTKASPESDIYACGLVFLECLTGNIAVPGNNIISIANKHAKEDLVIPAFVPDCLRKIIWKCCEKDPKKRYHDAKDIIRDLDNALPEACKQQEALKRNYSTTLSAKGISTKSNHKALYITIAAVILGAVIAGIAFFAGNMSKTQDTPNAGAPAAVAPEAAPAAQPTPAPQNADANAAQPAQPAPAALPTPAPQNADVNAAQPAPAVAPVPEAPKEETNPEPANGETTPEPANEENPQEPAKEEAAPADTQLPSALNESPVKAEDSKPKPKPAKPKKPAPAPAAAPAPAPAKPSNNTGKKVDSADIPLSIF